MSSSVPPSRVLVTGGAGNVAGWVLRSTPPGVDLHVTEHLSPVPGGVRSLVTVHRVDLRDVESVRSLIGELRPDVVLHTAYAQSDRRSIVDATAAVADAAAAVGAALVHTSTDVVFAGDEPPYAEDADPDPVTDYGRWKAEAERVAAAAVPDVCTTRTSLVVSLDPLDRATGAFAAALREGREVALFHDELRQPIRADDLADQLWALLALDRSERAGVWHLPGPEHLSRLELGLRVAERLALDTSTVRSEAAADVAPGRPRDPALGSVRRDRLGVRLRPVGARPGTVSRDGQHE